VVHCAEKRIFENTNLVSSNIVHSVYSHNNEDSLQVDLESKKLVPSRLILLKLQFHLATGLERQESKPTITSSAGSSRNHDSRIRPAGFKNANSGGVCYARPGGDASKALDAFGATAAAHFIKR